MTDVWPYRAASSTGRWYAMPGEAGLLMCTFPREDWTFEEGSRARDLVLLRRIPSTSALTGFEHQVAGHMIWEGLVEEVSRSSGPFDRYHASRAAIPGTRSRPGSLRSCDGVLRRISGCLRIRISRAEGVYRRLRAAASSRRASALSPRPRDEVFSQQIQDGVLTATIQLKYGSLRLRTISLSLAPNLIPKTAVITLNGSRVRARDRPRERPCPLRPGPRRENWAR